MARRRHLPVPHIEPALSAAAAVASVESTFREFISLTEASAATLGDSIGAVAGPYGAATRRSLVLHICDELIHHAAEASLLRDLYASR